MQKREGKKEKAFLSDHLILRCSQKALYTQKNNFLSSDLSLITLINPLKYVPIIGFQINLAKRISHDRTYGMEHNTKIGHQ